MPGSKIIYLGIKGTVIALDAATGQQIWATDLKGADFVQVVLDGDRLYATTQGEIFCLNPANGEALWQNPLKGFGLGLCSIATESISPSAILNFVAEKKRRDEQAASSAAIQPATPGN